MWKMSFKISILLLVVYVAYVKASPISSLNDGVKNTTEIQGSTTSIDHPETTAITGDLKQQFKANKSKKPKKKKGFFRKIKRGIKKTHGHAKKHVKKIKNGLKKGAKKVKNGAKKGKDKLTKKTLYGYVTSIPEGLSSAQKKELMKIVSKSSLKKKQYNRKMRKFVKKLDSKLKEKFKKLEKKYEDEMKDAETKSKNLDSSTKKWFKKIMTLKKDVNITFGQEHKKISSLIKKASKKQIEALKNAEIYLPGVKFGYEKADKNSDDENEGLDGLFGGNAEDGDKSSEKDPVGDSDTDPMDTDSVGSQGFNDGNHDDGNHDDGNHDDGNHYDDRNHDDGNHHDEMESNGFNDPTGSNGYGAESMVDNYGSENTRGIGSDSVGSHDLGNENMGGLGTETESNGFEGDSGIDNNEFGVNSMGTGNENFGTKALDSIGENLDNLSGGGGGNEFASDALGALDNIGNGIDSLGNKAFGNDEMQTENNGFKNNIIGGFSSNGIKSQTSGLKDLLDD